MARMRVCSQPGCPTISTKRRCDQHQAQAERARGTRQQRGYDAAHERERKRWQPRVDQGGVHCHAVACHMPSRLILLGQPWDLGHDRDTGRHRGPEHATCNRSEGGKASHAQ
jgi:hypothetical protein